MSIAWYLAVSAIVFSLGVIGVITRRNPLVVLLCLELMLNGANLSLIAFARMWGNSAKHDSDRCCASIQRLSTTWIT